MATLDQDDLDAIEALFTMTNSPAAAAIADVIFNSASRALLIKRIQIQPDSADGHAGVEINGDGDQPAMHIEGGSTAPYSVMIKKASEGDALVIDSVNNGIQITAGSYGIDVQSEYEALHMIANVPTQGAVYIQNNTGSGVQIAGNTNGVQIDSATEHGVMITGAAGSNGLMVFGGSAAVRFEGNGTDSVGLQISATGNANGAEITAGTGGDGMRIIGTGGSGLYVEGGDGAGLFATGTEGALNVGIKDEIADAVWDEPLIGHDAYQNTGGGHQDMSAKAAECLTFWNSASKGFTASQMMKLTQAAALGAFDGITAAEWDFTLTPILTNLTGHETLGALTIDLYLVVSESLYSSGTLQINLGSISASGWTQNPNLAADWSAAGAEDPSHGDNEWYLCLGQSGQVPAGVDISFNIGRDTKPFPIRLYFPRGLMARAHFVCAEVGKFKPWGYMRGSTEMSMPTDVVPLNTGNVLMMDGADRITSVDVFNGTIPTALGINISVGNWKNYAVKAAGGNTWSFAVTEAYPGIGEVRFSVTDAVPHGAFDLMFRTANLPNLEHRIKIPANSETSGLWGVVTTPEGYLVHHEFDDSGSVTNALVAASKKVQVGTFTEDAKFTMVQAAALGAFHDGISFSAFDPVATPVLTVSGHEALGTVNLELSLIKSESLYIDDPATEPNSIILGTIDATNGFTLDGNWAANQVYTPFSDQRFLVIGTSGPIPAGTRITISPYDGATTARQPFVLWYPNGHNAGHFPTTTPGVFRNWGFMRGSTVLPPSLHENVIASRVIGDALFCGGWTSCGAAVSPAFPADTTLSIEWADFDSTGWERIFEKNADEDLVAVPAGFPIPERARLYISIHAGATDVPPTLIRLTPEPDSGAAHSVVIQTTHIPAGTTMNAWVKSDGTCYRYNLTNPTLDYTSDKTSAVVDRIQKYQGHMMWPANVIPDSVEWAATDGSAFPAGSSMTIYLRDHAHAESHLLAAYDSVNGWVINGDTELPANSNGWLMVTHETVTELGGAVPAGTIRVTKDGVGGREIIFNTPACPAGKTGDLPVHIMADGSYTTHEVEPTIKGLVERAANAPTASSIDLKSWQESVMTCAGWDGSQATPLTVKWIGPNLPENVGWKLEVTNLKTDGSKDLQWTSVNLFSVVGDAAGVATFVKEAGWTTQMTTTDKVGFCSLGTPPAGLLILTDHNNNETRLFMPAASHNNACYYFNTDGEAYVESTIKKATTAGVVDGTSWTA